MDEKQWLESRDPGLLVEHLYQLYSGDQVNRNVLLKLIAAATGPCFTCRRFGQRLNVTPYAHACFTANSSCLGASIKADYLRDIVGNPWRNVSLGETLRCARGHAEWRVVCKKSYPVPLSMCVVCNEEGPPWADVINGVAPKWLTPEVISIAEAAGQANEHHRRLDPARLLVLADACEEAGCYDARCLVCRGSGRSYEWFDSEFGDVNFSRRPCKTCNKTGRVASEFLAHLRSGCTHVAGCWALALVLGNRKETG